jgi:hypothetical protein
MNVTAMDLDEAVDGQLPQPRIERYGTIHRVLV